MSAYVEVSMYNEEMPVYANSTLLDYTNPPELVEAIEIPNN